VRDITYFLIAFCLLPVLSYSQAGALDGTFSSDGIVITPIGSGFDEGRAVALQDDWKIVVAGYSYNGLDYDFALVRYNYDGTLDNAFGQGGIVTTSVDSANDYCYSLVVQPDGKIVAAGYTYNGFNKDFAVMRYNIDGTLDSTFDFDGIAITDFENIEDIGYATAIQSDGKIIVAGTGDDSYFALARYNNDGSLDTSFSSDGKALGSWGTIYSMAIQEDGKIVVVGLFYHVSNFNIWLNRFNSNGSFDSTFVVPEINYGQEENKSGHALALQNDGKIIVAGFRGARWESSGDFALIRINNDGSFDNSFGVQAKVFTDFGDNEFGRSVAVQADGKIVVVGYNSSEDLALARYNSDGSLDVNFYKNVGRFGKVNTDLGGDDFAYSVAVQKDGKIVVAGATNGDFAVARYRGGPQVVTIYPNPVNGIFQTANIEFRQARVEIYDSRGRLIYRKTYMSAQEIAIDVSSLERGIYLAVITDDTGNRVSGKFVKM
jgi:uncharacterized delta-60 repeat protein